VIKGKGEINYTQFMQWMTGQSVLAPDQLAAMEASAKPMKKSDVANRTFNSTTEFVKNFLHEQEFVDVVKEIQEESLLDKVRIFVAMDEFK
jgi:hypothetical protein